MVDSKTAPPHAIGLDGTRTKTGAAESKYDFSWKAAKLQIGFLRQEERVRKKEPEEVFLQI
jgi:hypothetical protein